MVEFAASVAVAEFPEHAADVPELVIYPAPLVIALLFRDISVSYTHLTLPTTMWV